ncbi:hypothetical protein FRX31_028423 [Thalictrum thalictroides]|uniref:Uncharacterized protein n=1 Tax=Thalictrum thalictroides TaxID=46969 RepID=A0A7J6VCN7_THATH|nr:hypothetical protein FRX31_028423 [Thalictrum thalictroides]
MAMKALDDDDDDGHEGIRLLVWPYAHIVNDDVIPKNLPDSWIDQKGDIDVNFAKFDENVDYDSPTNKEKVDEDFVRKKSKVPDIDMKSDNIIYFNLDVDRSFSQLCIKGYVVHYG